MCAQDHYSFDFTSVRTAILNIKKTNMKQTLTYNKRQGAVNDCCGGNLCRQTVNGDINYI